MVPGLFNNLRKALLPLMHERTYEALKEVEADIERTRTAYQQQAVTKGQDNRRQGGDSDGVTDSKELRVLNASEINERANGQKVEGAKHGCVPSSFSFMAFLSRFR